MPRSNCKIRARRILGFAALAGRLGGATATTLWKASRMESVIFGHASRTIV